MKTKILAPVLVIGVALMMGVAGGIASFSDTEESSNNTFQAGTLNLKVGTSDSTTYSFGFSDVAPGDTETASVNIQNTGSIRGDSLSVDFVVLDTEPTDDTEPEIVAESTLGDTWDISTQIELTIYWDTDEDGTAEDATDQVQTKISDGSDPLLLSELAGKTVDFDGLDAGEVEPLKMDMTLLDVGNEYQGDQSRVDLTFNLEQ